MVLTTREALVRRETQPCRGRSRCRCLFVTSFWNTHRRGRSSPRGGCRARVALQANTRRLGNSRSRLALMALSLFRISTVPFRLTHRMRGGGPTLGRLRAISSAPVVGAFGGAA